jgi:hypothetical protein
MPGHRSSAVPNETIPNFLAPLCRQADLLTYTLETVMGNGKKIGDFTGADVAELAWLAEPDIPILSIISDSMHRDRLDWATA